MVLVLMYETTPPHLDPHPIESYRKASKDATPAHRPATPRAPGARQWRAAETRTSCQRGQTGGRRQLPRSPRVVPGMVDGQGPSRGNDSRPATHLVRSTTPRAESLQRGSHVKRGAAFAAGSRQKQVQSGRGSRRSHSAGRQDPTNGSKQGGLRQIAPGLAHHFARTRLSLITGNRIS